MIDRKKSLEAFYILLSSLSTKQQEKILEVYLLNGKKISFKIEAITNQDNANTRHPEIFYGRRGLSIVRPLQTRL